MDFTKPQLLRELFAERFTSLGTSNTNHQAFQLAVWEIVHETNAILTFSDPNKGVLHASDSDATTLANGWLSTLTGQAGDAAYTAGYLSDGSGDVKKLAELVGLQGTNGQDQVAMLLPGFTTDGSGGIVPIPAPLALVGIVPCLALPRRLTAKVA